MTIKKYSNVFKRRKQEPTPIQNPWNWQESPFTLLLADFISSEVLLLEKVKKASLEDVDDEVEHMEGVPVREEEEEEENFPISLLNISSNISCNSSKVSP